MKRLLMWIAIVIVVLFGLLWLNLHDKRDWPTPIVPIPSRTTETPEFPPPSDTPDSPGQGAPPWSSNPSFYPNDPPLVPFPNEPSYGSR